ncbi:hypothetical protein M404DRAFT_20091 [Pisolithus tinctorius Marx 270]|uniref:Uncharacterized protein n=1 Tax=Pisolithus tinctorius Marx 270 TaxID=870435 RepID=A0A0C3PU35_PISTI|nr:hypothetical protein M404DRAFT_20091 [Pisolithus tinctorius Marx 270]
MPFLHEYKPRMNWVTGRIDCWDDQEPAIQKTTLSTELEAATSVFAEDDIPLPHHRKDLDHEIHLKDGFKPKWSSVYPMAPDKLKVLNEFITENLACRKI